MGPGGREGGARASGPRSARGRGARDVLARFEAVWGALFSSPIHLDSALAKERPAVRAALAEPLKLILRRPASTAAALGLELPTGEPWSVRPPALATWAPGRALARALIAEPPEVAARIAAGPPADPDRDHPPAVLAALAADFGPSRARAIARVLGEQPPLVLRARRAVGLEALEARLLADGAVPRGALERSAVAPLALRVREHAPLRRHPAFLDGAFEIQDDGAQLLSLFALWPEVYAPLLTSEPGPAARPAPPALPPPPGGLTVVDACAGAGGKTLAIADALGGRGRVFAYDVSARRLEALRERARRAGLTSVKTTQLEVGREAEVAAAFAGRADLVLVDAPCSGWGVLRRNPDAKWRLDPAALARLPGLQARLLETYAPLVAAGGRLVYATCTFQRAETSAVVEARPELRLDASGYVGPGPCDGFFAAAWTR